MEDRIILSSRGEKTVYREGDTIVKIFSDLRPKADVLQEALNQCRAQEAGISVPTVKEIRRIDGKWAIVSEFIEGETIAERIAAHPEEKDELMDRFVELQLELHRKRAPLLTLQVPMLHHHIHDADLDAVTRYELHIQLDNMPQKRELCHGDFRPDNVIIRPDGSYCITDWPRAGQGNGAADAALSWVMIAISNGEELAEDYLNRFCEKGDVSSESVKKWIPIMAASLMHAYGKKEEIYLKSLIKK